MRFQRKAGADSHHLSGLRPRVVQAAYPDIGSGQPLVSNYVVRMVDKVLLVNWNRLFIPLIGIGQSLYQ